MSLSATAEIPMAGRFMNAILPEAELPLKFVAFNHCFRTEIGGMGTQTRGLYRVHQFSKVEMFVVSTPDQSDVRAFASALQLIRRRVSSYSIDI